MAPRCQAIQGHRAIRGWPGSLIGPEHMHYAPKKVSQVWIAEGYGSGKVLSNLSQRELPSWSELS